MPPEDLGSQATADTRSNERRLLEQQIAVDNQRHGQETWLGAVINAPLSAVLSTDDVKTAKALVDLENQVKAKEAAGDQVGLTAMDAQIKAAIGADVKASDATFNSQNCSTFLADVVATVPLFMRGAKGRAWSAALTAANSAHVGDSGTDQFMELALGAGRGYGSQVMFEKMGKGEFLGSVTNPGIKNGVMGYTNRTFSTFANWDTYKDGFGAGLARVGGQAVDVPAILGDIAIGSMAHGLSGTVNAKFDNILNRNAVLGNMFTATVIGVASGAHGEATHQLGNVIFDDGTFDLGKVFKAAGVEGFKNMLAGGAGARLDGGHTPTGERTSMFVPDPDVSPPAARPARPGRPASPASPTNGPIRPETEVSMGNDDYRVVSSNPHAVVVEHDAEAHISTGATGTTHTGTMESNGYVSAGTGKVKVNGADRNVPLWRRNATPLEPEVFVDLNKLQTPPAAAGQVRVEKVDNLIAVSTPEVQRLQQQRHWSEPVDRVADLEGIPKKVVGHATDASNRVVVATDAPPPSGTAPTINVAHNDIGSYQGVRIYGRDPAGTATSRNYYANTAGDVYDMALQQDGSYVGTLHPEYRALDATVRHTAKPAQAAAPGIDVRLGSQEATVVAATNDRVVLHTGAGDVNASINTALAGAPPLTGARMTVDYAPAGTMDAQINDASGVPSARKLQLFTSRANPNEVYVNAADLSGTGTPADSQPVRITDLLARPANEISNLNHVTAPDAAWTGPRNDFGRVIRNSTTGATTGADLGTVAGHSMDGRAYVVESSTPAPGNPPRAVTQSDLLSARYKQVMVYEQDATTKALTPRVMFADQTAGGRVFEMQPEGSGYQARETNYLLADATLRPHAPEHNTGARMQIGSTEATLRAWDPTHRNAALQFEPQISVAATPAPSQPGAMTGHGFIDSGINVNATLPGGNTRIVRLFRAEDPARPGQPNPDGRVYVDLSNPAATTPAATTYWPAEVKGVVIKSEADLQQAFANRPQPAHLENAQQEIGRDIQDSGTGYKVVGHDLEGTDAVVLSGNNTPSSRLGTVDAAHLATYYDPVSVRTNGRVSDAPVLYYAAKGVVAPGTPAPIYEMVPEGNLFRIVTHPEFELRQTQDATGAVETAQARAARQDAAERNDPTLPENQASAYLRDATVNGATRQAADDFKTYIRDNASKIEEAGLRDRHPEPAAQRLIDEAYTELLATGRTNLQRVNAQPNDLTAQTQYIDWALSVGKDVASRVPLTGDALNPLRVRLEKAQDAVEYLNSATTNRNVATSLPKFREAVADLLGDTTNKLPNQTNAQAMAANYDMRNVLLRAADRYMEGPPEARRQARDYINQECDNFGRSKGTELLQRAALPGDDATRLTDFIIFASKQSPEVLTDLERTAVLKPANTAVGEVNDINLQRSVSDLVGCARHLNDAYGQLRNVAKGIGDVDTFNRFIANDGRYLASSLRELIQHSPDLTPEQKQRAIGNNSEPGALQQAYRAAYPQAAELLRNASAEEGTYEDYHKLLDFVHQHGPDALEVTNDNEGILLRWMLSNRPEYNLPMTAGADAYLRNSFQTLQHQTQLAAEALRLRGTNPDIDLAEPNFLGLAQGAAHWGGLVVQRTRTKADYFALRYDLFDWASKTNDPLIVKAVSKAFDANTLSAPERTDPLHSGYVEIMGRTNSAGNFTGPEGIEGVFQQWSQTEIQDKDTKAPIQAGIDRRAALVSEVHAALADHPELEQRMRQQLELTASSDQHEFLSGALQGLDLPSLLTELDDLPSTASQDEIGFLFGAIRKRITPTTDLTVFQNWLRHATGDSTSGMTNNQWNFIAQTLSTRQPGSVNPELAQHFLFPGEPVDYVPQSGGADSQIISRLRSINDNPTLAEDIFAPVPGSNATPLAVRIQQFAGRHLQPDQEGKPPGKLKYDRHLEKINVGSVLRGNLDDPTTATTPMAKERTPQIMSYGERVAVMEKLFAQYNPPQAGANAPQAPVITADTLQNLVKLGDEDPAILKRITDAAGSKGIPSATRKALLEMVGQLSDAGATGEDINIILDWSSNAHLLRIQQPQQQPRNRGPQQQPPALPADENQRRAKMYNDMATEVVRSLVAPDLSIAPTTAVLNRKTVLDQADLAGTTAWGRAHPGVPNPLNAQDATAAYQADKAKAQAMEGNLSKLVN
jgi:hypothetical protein